MTSTIQRTWKFENGVMSFPYRELPNWYGIEDIGFIFINEWSDPQLEYKGKLYNSYIIEDTMHTWYREECEENGIEETDDGFGEYMRERAYDVYELLEVGQPL